MPVRAFLTKEEIQDRIAQEAASDKPRKLTAEQIEAIYSSGNNILVSASAGSGKTFVMVERILDMISRGVSIEQLFISTFTVKAAGELRERLEKRLMEALSQADRNEDRLFLSDQLNQLATADIGTMDAFTQKLVSQYGYLLGISPIFRIMQDKSEQDILKNEVFADLFEDYMQGEDFKCFQDLVCQFAGNRKDSKAFRSAVYKVYAFSQATADPEKWLSQTFLKAHESWTNYDALPDSMIETFLDSMADTASQLRELTDSPDYVQTKKDGKPTAVYSKHLKMIEKLTEWSVDFAALYGRDRLGQLASDVASLIPSGSDVTVNKIKYPIFRKLQAQLVGLKHLDIIFKYQSRALPILRLMRDFVGDFSDQYLQAKIQENAFEFSDIAHFAIRILEENPDVAEHFQNKYHEVMVDEYQDNNHTQERMLELLSNGHNRFMVGDIKQSIYRFRQADPQIFNSKFKEYQADPSAGKLILLKENFRSRSGVLAATNGVFQHLMDEEVGDIRYDKTHFLLAGSSAQKEADPKDKTEVLIYNTDETAVADDEQMAAISRGEIDLVAKEIIRLHNEQQVPFSDITLLVSSRTRNDALLTAFETYGIPVVSDGGESNYLKSLEVMIMLDTLRVINNPLNDYALVALLRSAMFGFDEDDLTRLSLQAKNGELYDKLCLAQTGNGLHPELLTQPLAQKLTAFMETFQEWRTFSKMHALYDLIWKIYNDRFYYDYVGALPRAEQRQANLYALALRANNFEKTGFKGLSRFIRMIDKILDSQNDLADVEVALPKNAVQLMTIHKSKGLEFKYVFVLNIDKTFSMEDIRSKLIISRKNGIGVKYLADMKEEFDTELPKVQVNMDTLPYQINRRELKLATLSEQMRLLYVAMTRAEKKLYLVGKGSKDKLTDKFDGRSDNGRLPASARENMTSFQDWLLALSAAFSDKALQYSLRFVESSEVTADQIGRLETSDVIQTDDLTDNRQTKDIKRALTILESVEELNQLYSPAINLPSVRTPSQIKAFYEPVMNADGVEIMDNASAKTKVGSTEFRLPDFNRKPAVTAAAVGTAVHELMQRLEISDKVTKKAVMEALSAVQADDDIKAKIDVDKILAFFATDLGQLIQANRDKLKREAPFAMLKEDFVSQEKSVFRGIIDGYLLFEDRILLFDYKTDKFTNSQIIKERYQAQMALYAEALSKSYQIQQIDKYLILLGGDSLEVVAL
ncbi:helicase-exonuclease AddAB subunit AddA [Streptococcus dentiloxodontae]